MSYSQTKQLAVYRKLSDASSIIVGELAQNKQGIYFQYNEHYLDNYFNLSPFKLNFNTSLQLAPHQPHANLHGAFSDSLPDGWGLLLMDRVFRQAGILPTQITAMDRLAFVGHKAMGALHFKPQFDHPKDDDPTKLSVAYLGLEAQSLFDGQTSKVLQALVNAGGSGGARPKALLYLKEHDEHYCSTQYKKGSQAYLIKFTSAQLALGHEEGLCEAVYLTIAANAGIDVPKWKLLNAPASSGAKKWLALKRFDTTQTADDQEGRLHFHSASGLLDADYRMPSLDYEDLIKASSLLCKSPAAGQAMFKRMMFNLFALNQDDHSKNWAFLQQDNGTWQLAPFYDITFSPSAYNEHATAFLGFGKNPSLKVIEKLAKQANFSQWKEAQDVITEVFDVISGFEKIAHQFNLKPRTIKLINQQLNHIYQNNKALLIG